MNTRSSLVVILVLTSFACLAHGNRISDFFGQIGSDLQNRISDVIGDMDKGLKDLMSDMGDFTKSLEQVSDCYVDEFGGINMNIFDGSLNFKNVAAKYYEAFPNKTVSQGSMTQLLNSVRDIISKCNDPSNRTSAKYGFTELSDKTDEEMQQMVGVIPPQEDQNSRRKRQSEPLKECELKDDGIAEQIGHLNWNELGYETPVKNQKSCGSCWSFAAVGALEMASLIRDHNTQKTMHHDIDLSEQRLVNCAKSFAGYQGSGGCSGGNAKIAFDYLKKEGTTTESNRPYTASEGTCHNGDNIAMKADKYCIHSKYYYGSEFTTGEVSDLTIKKAALQNGPLYITINANPLQYRNLRGGILDEPNCSTQTNHAVLLVGFDSDNSWIIKNSWGPNWGDKGYFKVIRGKNMCGINTEIAWPIYLKN